MNNHEEVLAILGLSLAFFTIAVAYSLKVLL